MTSAPFARALVRKSGRALRIARLALNAGDNDSAVNRSYYAMFDIVRAALLRAGVAEDRLPRTHSGVIEAFRTHAVQSGQVDRELGAELSRVESLRIKADYTGTEIELDEAAEVVRKAEGFVQTVERVFGLDEASLGTEYEDHKPDHDDKVSEPVAGVPTNASKDAHLGPDPLEETRRQARENWLRLRQQETQRAAGRGHDRESDHGAKEGQSHSLDGDFEE